MSTLELVLNMLAEATTTELSKAKAPENFEKNRQVAKEGGAIAGDARKAIEASSGRPVITSQNAVDFTQVLSEVVNALPDVEETDQEEPGVKKKPSED